MNRNYPARQQGVVLFIALVVLVAMSIIGLSIIRQGSSAQMISGNLAFQQQAGNGAELGVETARSWLMGQAGETLDNSSSANGYIANGLATDPQREAPDQLPWASGRSITDTLGNTVVYLIQRLCPSTGSVLNGNNLCVFEPVSTDKGSIDAARQPSESLQPYYRISVRVTGPRDSRTYTQVLVY